MPRKNKAKRIARTGAALLRRIGKVVAPNETKMIRSISKPLGKFLQPKPARSRTVSAPVSVGRLSSTGKPEIVRLSSEAIRLKHSEFIGDLSMSTTWSSSYARVVGIGLSAWFPWGSLTALQYQRFSFNRLVFKYVPYSSTSTAGSVILSVHYDVDGFVGTNGLSDLPLSKADQLSTSGCVRGSAWLPLNVSADCKYMNRNGDFMVTSTNTPVVSTSSVAGYFPCALMICTSDGTAAAACGEIHVEYDVTLSQPSTSLATVASSSSALINGAGGGITNANMFGNAAIIRGGISVSASGNTLTLNTPGDYLVSVGITGTVLTETLPIITGTIDTAVVQMDFLRRNAAATKGEYHFLCRATLPGRTIILDPASWTTTLTASRIQIAKFHSALSSVV